MWPDYYSDSMAINVSRESCEKLEIYHGLLLKWQKAINLVSPKTIEDAWVRHFADSAQLCRYIPEGTKCVMDWGSGAGFPAMVLAILRPELEVHIVESDERKCQFIRAVSRETSAPIRIHTSRIEDLETKNIQPELITARALASAEKLLDYTVPWLAQNPELKMLLLKGALADEELEIARKSFDFEVQSHASVTDPAASILSLSSIKKL